MSLLIWVAAAWLAAAAGVTITFFAAKRSRFVHAWLFGEKPTAEIRRLAVSANEGEVAARQLAA